MTLDQALRILNDPALTATLSRSSTGEVQVEMVGGHKCIYVEGYLEAEELIACATVLQNTSPELTPITEGQTHVQDSEP